MGNNKKTLNSKMHNYEKINYRNIWPILLLAAVPLIVFGKIYDTGLEQFYWFSSARKSDLYLYYKMWAVILIATIMLIKIAVYAIKNKGLGKFEKRDLVQWLPLAGYLILSLVSTILSDYTSLGIWGGVDQFESIFTVIGYAVIALYIYLFVTNEKEIIVVLRSQAITAMIVGVLGFLQRFGIDFVTSSWMMSMARMIYGDNVTINGGSVLLASTLYNPNYAGVYCVILLPVIIGLLLKEKCIGWKIFYAVDVVLLLLLLFGSNSFTGAAVLAAIVFLAFLMNIKKLIKNKIIFAGTVIAVVAISIIFATINDGYYFNKLLDNVKVSKQEADYGWDLVTSKDNVALRSGEDWVYVSLNADAEKYEELLIFDTEHGKLQAFVDENEYLHIEGDQFEKFSFNIGYIFDDYIGFVVDDGKFSYPFIYINGSYYYYYDEKKFTNIDTTLVERAKFLDGYENFASSRGYIWARTLPLLKKTIFLGSGRDTFVVTFPNDDLVGVSVAEIGKLNITRPHNIYLQLMVQDGVLAALLWIATFVIYAIVYLKNRRNDKEKFNFYLFLSVIAFLLMGLANDSLVVTTPVMWVMMGLGIVGNRMVKEENCEKE